MDQTGPFFVVFRSPGSPRSSDQGAVGQVAQERPGIHWKRPNTPRSPCYTSDMQVVHMRGVFIHALLYANMDK